ncbi:transforming acidic coiled-coil-containing protein 3-like [Phymastichus coffea]|uniref:transforming acidic coiled-coil-containing protein 3-like n=1 Tax=Phymastichus coffea TaxID=108790 RepID=UPI00273CE350|nr:transforming acidic coiled-coil-containing protein 3-like [Phymastichus coffea]
MRLSEKLETVSKHLLSLEDAFNDVHKKYERAKVTIELLNRNTEILKSSMHDHEECMQQKQQQFDRLKDHAVERLNQANVQLDLAEKSFASERSSLLEALKNSEIQARQLSGQLEQKDRENAELFRICDFLLQTFKEPKNYSSDDLIQSNVTKWLNDTRTVSNVDDVRKVE